MLASLPALSEKKNIHIKNQLKTNKAVTLSLIPVKERAVGTTTYTLVGDSFQ